MASLAMQKRLAMSLMSCGQRKVWLDPAKKAIIAKARTRDDVRDLIAQEVIQFKPTHRGVRNSLTKMLVNNNARIKFFKQSYQEKQTHAQFSSATTPQHSA